MAAALGELVPRTEPLFLDQDREAADGAVIRVEAKLCQGRELGCAIPSVGAVHAAASLVAFNFIHHQSSAAQQPPYKTEPASSHLQQIIINKFKNKIKKWKCLLTNIKQ